MRSVHVQKDKSIFKLEELPLQRYAESLGLPGAPKVKFLNKEIAKRKKNASHATASLQQAPVEDSSDGEEDDDSDDSSSGEAQTSSKPEKVSSLSAIFVT